MLARKLFPVSLALIVALMGAPHPQLAAQTIAPRPNVVITKLPELTYTATPADFNGDGVADLVAGQSGGQLVLALGTGIGTFGDATLIANGPLRPLTVGDFNGDGLIDVLAVTPQTPANLQPDIYAVPGNGNGTFATAIPVATDMASIDVISGLAADFDGDGNRDFAALLTNRVLVYPGRGDFAFDPPVVLVTDPFTSGMIAADFDGNGQTDVAVATEVGVDLFLHTGGFLFTFGVIRLDPRALAVTARDMNGDGFLDLIVTAGDFGPHPTLGPWRNGYVFVMLGNGDGTFQSPARFDTNIGPTTVVAGDFTGDGAPDVATGHQSYGVACESWNHLWDSVSILPGLGTGQLGPAATFALGNSEDSADDFFYRRDHHSLKTSDLNADGRTDLIASPGAILLGTPPAENRSPLADAGTPRTNITGSMLPYVLGGSAVDPDNDWLSFQWTDESGAVLGTLPRPCIYHTYAGSQTFALTVADGRGGVSVDTVTYTFGPPPPPALLPLSIDIGTVASGGDSSFDGTAYTVHGSGADIWDTADAFHYVHRMVQGDFEITARVTGVQNVHRWTKAGVMLRETTAASSRHAFVFNAPTALNGVAFQRRLVEGDVTLHTAGPQVAPPGWLRLRRLGDVVSAFHRQSESDAWTLVGMQTFTGLAQDLSVGLAVTSHLDGTLATATFDNVAIAAVVVPDEWTNVDVGAVGATGSGSSSRSTHTVHGSGADIWGAADAFHFRYQTRSGDFRILALVRSVENVHRWTKAGLMVRESLDPGARHAIVLATPTAVNGLAFQRRPVANGSSVHTAGPPLTAPVWLLLDRSGDTVSGYFSTSGTPDSWVLIDRQSFAGLADTLNVGLAVTSHLDGTLAAATFEAVTLNDSLPWRSSDLGAIGIGGSDASSGPAQVTMRASGADIWGYADAFRYHYAPWSGDGAITVRVVSFDNTHPWAKAGVMFRETLDADAKQVMTVLTPANGVAVQYRAAAGQASSHAASYPATAPEWLRLTRRGDEFTGDASEDGVTWQTVGHATVPMNADIYVGLALTSHDNTTLTTAEFESWQVQHGDAPPSPSFAITSPAPDSTLRAARITFTWEGAGDEFWLDIGTAPGRSDLYASASLGQAQRHTVTGLPLNGTTVHVRLRRRTGQLVETVDARYTAAIRKGLLIIADFADRRLEDWTGAGMKNVADVSAELGRMAAHWAWLSRGLETFQWNIVRVQLPQAAVPDAYPGVAEFRTAVITLARQQVDTADYDVDADGIIDTAWIIVSNGNLDIGDYAIGGATGHGGANCFVDGQSSVSVVAQATGNFTHEVGHNLGLPEMYGRYGTLGTLTLMSYSWPVPPPDFAAYERLRLGWLEPQVIGQTTRDVWLPSANDTMAGVMIPTTHETEYFLIEYRKRPASGFGSATPDFNGLAVYHVSVGSTMSFYPPIVKLEPADGAIEYSQPSDPLDLVYPENPVLLRPMVLRSYWGEEVFRLENVSWRDGGLAFDIVMPGS